MCEIGLMIGNQRPETLTDKPAKRSMNRILSSPEIIPEFGVNGR
jgi:hypothetical protein